MNYKLLITDLDDTLLDDHLQIGEENLEQLKRFQRAGGRVVVCTGRASKSLLPFLSQIYDTIQGQYFISYNGAHISEADSLKEIFSAGLSPELTLELLALVKKHHLIAQIYKGDYFVLEQNYPQALVYRKQTNMDWLACGSFETYVDFITPKILVHGTPETLAPLYNEAVQISRGRFHSTFSKPFYLEFLNPTVNKGSALLWLCGHLGINPSEVLAMGDGENDIEMLKSAGLGLAVKNGRPKLIEAMGGCFPFSSSEGAVAKAIRKYMFGESIE